MHIKLKYKIYYSSFPLLHLLYGPVKRECFKSHNYTGTYVCCLDWISMLFRNICEYKCSKIFFTALWSNWLFIKAPCSLQHIIYPQVNGLPRTFEILLLI